MQDKSMAGKIMYGCLVFATALNLGVFALKDKPEQRSVGITPVQSKRQTATQNDDFDLQQANISQEYLDFLQQQSNDESNPIHQTQFRQKNQQPIFGSRVLNSAFPPTTTTTTTLSPFGAEQVRLQQEYASQTLLEQQSLFLRPRVPPNQPLSTQPQFQPQPLIPNQSFQFQLSPTQQQFQTRFPVQPQPQQSQFQAQALEQQQNTFLQSTDSNQNFDSQQNPQLLPQNDNSFSFAQIQFGQTEPSPVETTQSATSFKGQRSVSKPKSNNLPESITQQSIEYTTVNPVLLNARLLQNAVYIHHNGQIYKPTEETDQVVYIPRKKFPSITTTFAPWTVFGQNEQKDDAVFISNPTYERQKSIVSTQRPISNQQKSRQESKKSNKAQIKPLGTRTEPPPNETAPSELLPDNFFSSLLTQFQQEPALVFPKARGSQRSKAVNSNTHNSETSRYIPDKSQLQLLQFNDEQKSLSNSELKVLDDAGIQLPIKGQSRQAFRSRPVPQQVELDQQQRQYLASQGIRNLYRVDYDESGNPLPLTYVLALDNRTKQDNQQE